MYGHCSFQAWLRLGYLTEPPLPWTRLQLRVYNCNIVSHVVVVVVVVVCVCVCFESRFGLAVRLISRGTSVRIRFGSPFSSTAVVCGHCLVTLSLTINQTVKWLSSLPTLMHESFSLFPHLHTPFPPSPRP